MVGTPQAGIPGAGAAAGSRTRGQQRAGGAEGRVGKRENAYQSGLPPAPAELLPLLTGGGALNNKAAPRVHRGTTCTACKKAKVNCGGTYPCTRCFRKSLRCVMPARYHKHRPKDDPDVAAREAAERGASFSVLVELAFERCDPSGTANTMSQAFMQVMAEGAVIRPAVIMGLQCWKMRSVLCGVDVTCGGAAMLAQRADPPITALELEGPAFALDMPDSAIRPMLAADIQRLRGSIDEFRASDTFRHLDDDPEHKAIFATVFDTQGRMFEAGNALFEETFLGSLEFLEESLAHRQINTVLFTSLIAPEDRVLWYRAAFQICFTPAQRVVEFVKLFNREGEIGLWIMEVSKAALPASHQIMGGIITRFSQAPSSRHLTSGPCRHHRVHRFRVRSHTQPLTTTAIKQGDAEPAAVVVAVPPALAAIPTAASVRGHATAVVSSATAAAVAAAAQEAERLFGRPDMHKLLHASGASPFVTGSGAMPSSPPAAMGATAPELSRAHRSAHKAARVRATAAAGMPRPQPAAAADEEWRQFLAEQRRAAATQGGGGAAASTTPPLPFPVQSTEEEVLWRDVVRLFREGEE